MNKKILITSAGGVGSNSLVMYIKKYDKNCFFYGTHYDKFELSKSNVEKKFIVSRVVNTDKFIKDHLKIISKFKIDAFQYINYAYENLTFGALIVNAGPGLRIESFPFGGMKDSGSGREGVVMAMNEMMEEKILIN